MTEPLPLPPTTELEAEDGYEYGGGGPEYMEGLMSGGAGMWRADVIALLLYECSLLIFSMSR